MPGTKWKKNYSVNIDLIDNQHKKLFDMIDNFYENIRAKSNNELIGELIGQMKSYVKEHFNTEERLFEKYNYPDAEQHKKQHAEYIEKVESLEKRLNNGQLVISFEVTNFLKQWISNHIMVTDKKYSEFMNQNGVT